MFIMTTTIIVFTLLLRTFYLKQDKLEIQIAL